MTWTDEAINRIEKELEVKRMINDAFRNKVTELRMAALSKGVTNVDIKELGSSEGLKFNLGSKIVEFNPENTLKLILKNAENFFQIKQEDVNGYVQTEIENRIFDR